MDTKDLFYIGLGFTVLVVGFMTAMQFLASAY